MFEPIAAGHVNAHAPVERVLKHTQPGRHGHRGLPRRWCPWPLPHLNAALRVWHHCQVSAVGRTQACDACWTPIRIHRVLGRGCSPVIGILHRHQMLGLDRLQNISTLKNHSSCEQKCSVVRILYSLNQLHKLLISLKVSA